MVCNDASIDNGQPTEIALLEFASKMNIQDKRLVTPRTSQVPFTSDRKYMSVTYGNTTYIKGSAESVLNMCVSLHRPNQSTRLDITNGLRDIIIKNIKAASERGLRIILIAKEHQGNGEGMSLIGFFGLEDPLREGVVETIKTLYSGGVRVVMITGDSGIFLNT